MRDVARTVSDLAAVVEGRGMPQGVAVERENAEMSSEQGATLVDQVWHIDDCEVRFTVKMPRPLAGERWPDITPVVEAVENLVTDWSAAVSPSVQEKP